MKSILATLPLICNNSNKTLFPHYFSAKQQQFQPNTFPINIAEIITRSNNNSRSTHTKSQNYKKPKSRIQQMTMQTAEIKTNFFKFTAILHKNHPIQQTNPKSNAPIKNIECKNQIYHRFNR